MELQQNLEVIFNVDAVLRGQGADASILRKRGPGPVNVAQEAMREGLSLLHLQGEAGALVQVTPGCIMVSKKSLSMVMGFGAHLQPSGKTCTFRKSRLTCRYQDHNQVVN